MRLSVPLKVAPTEAVCKGHQGVVMNKVFDPDTDYILSVEETGTEAWHNHLHSNYFITIGMMIVVKIYCVHLYLSFSFTIKPLHAQILQ